LQKNEALRLKLSAVKDRLEKANVPWVVFAGAAAHGYGSNRHVTDIDILVRAADQKKVKAVLKDLDIEGFDVVADFEVKTDQGICSFFMDDEMIERTRWMRLLGVLVPVIPVEDNIVFKAILQRGENQGKHDIDDIEHMIKHEKVDLEYLKKRIRRYQAEKRVTPLLKSLIPNI